MGSKKGQEVVFESVLIFSIGVAIFIVLYTVFNIYQYSYFTPVGTSDQLGEVRDYLTAEIISISARDGDASVIIQIPKKAGVEDYIIELDSATGLNISTEGDYKSSNLFGLGESFELIGAAASPRGKITLKKEGNQIIIE